MMNLKHFALLSLLSFLGLGSASALGNAARMSDMAVCSLSSRDKKQKNKGKENAKPKPVKMGEYIEYSGNVNEEGQPEGKGTLEVTITKNGLPIGKDVITGTFTPGSTIVPDAEITFASGWKFKGGMSYRIRESYDLIAYNLQAGYLLAFDPNTNRADMVMKLLPVGVKNDTNVYLQRSLPSNESTISVPMFHIFSPANYYDWLNTIASTTAVNQVPVANDADANQQKIDDLKKKRNEYEYFLNNRVSGMDPAFFQQQIAIIDKQIAELEEKNSTAGNATNTEGGENSETLPFPKEMTSSLFSRQANSAPAQFIYPLRMDDFESCGSFYFVLSATIKSIDESKWGTGDWGQDSPTGAFKSIGINLDDIHEFWALDYYGFTLHFEDGTELGNCDYQEAQDEYAISVKIPDRDNDEFIYTPTRGSDMFDTGCILSMKVKRDGIDFEMKGKARTSGHDCQVNYKNANGDRYEGTGFLLKDSSYDYLHWVFQTYYMPNPINTKALESSFWPVTGTWKRANGKAEEWYESTNRTAKQEEKKANEQGLVKALPPFYQKYGKANVDQFVYGDPTTGMSIAMIRDLVYTKNQYIRKKIPYTILSKRAPSVSEAIKYGSGIEVYRLGSTSGIYNDVYYAFVLYVRNGKVVAGHVNW